MSLDAHDIRTRTTQWGVAYIVLMLVKRPTRKLHLKLLKMGRPNDNRNTTSRAYKCRVWKLSYHSEMDALIHTNERELVTILLELEPRPVTSSARTSKYADNTLLYYSGLDILLHTNERELVNI